jgi:hypothetical protein
VLDVHFCLWVCDSWLSEQGSLQANAICVKALRAYFLVAGNNSLAVKSGEWYEARVLEVAGEVEGRYKVLMGVSL